MAQTKAELADELESLTTKSDLVEILGSKLLKNDLASLLEDESGATKEELVHKLERRNKDELVEAVTNHLSKDELEKVVDERREDDKPDEPDEQEQEQEQDDEQEQNGEPRERDEPQERRVHDESTDIDWSAKLEWSPPPRPTPAPVTFAGAAPFQPGQRVRVDISGLPTLGVFMGKGASAAGTIVGVDAQQRMVRVYLDAVFGGEKEIVIPPERVQPDV